MKYIFLLISFFSTFCFGQQNKDSLNLILEYLPNKNYTKNVNIKCLVEMELNSSNQEILQMLKEEMQGTSRREEINENLQYIFTSGNIKPSDNSFPISLKIINTKEKTDNMEVKGVVKKGEFPIFSIVSPPVDNKEDETEILNSAKEIISRIPVLSKKLKIGDSFTTSSLIPISDNDSDEFKVLTLYTLKEIKGNKAFFDFEQKYVATMIIEDSEMPFVLNGSGTGKGKAEYDLNNHFFIAEKYDAVINLNSEKIENIFSLNAVIKVNSNENTTIK